MLALGQEACYCALQHSAGFAMSSQDLPQDTSPLSAWDYWRESVSTWTDFSQRAGQIVTGQLGGSAAKTGQKLDPKADTLATELLRTFSDMNLRHWQNTARLLESMPDWMNMPNTMTGSAMVDWFDNLQRGSGFFGTAPASNPSASEKPITAAPETLSKPAGKADDLTRIKGIGPKRSVQLNALGIYHFKQIASWSATEARWVDDALASPGRVSRDDWVNQARLLSANGSATQH